MMLLALTRSEWAARFGIAAGVAVGVWLVILFLLAAASRPRRPHPAPAGMDMGGDEPPAVVGMLTNGWRVGRETVPATLLDLAARKIVAIDAVGPERFVVRVTGGTAAGALTPYEDQVLGHVRRLAASDGTVACEALTTGPEAQAAGWWRLFESAVRKDARDRNLSRGRWSGWMMAVLAVTALVPSVLVALAVVVTPDNRSSKSDDNPIGGFVGITAMAELALLALPGSMRGERDTPTGRAAAARWLGLREYLHDDGTFADAPPAAVAVWDRYLAYGAAMGVAAGAVRALPLGAESDKVAWSSYGGRWRVVEIDYPKRVPPGWGKHPALASAIGLASLAVGLLVARLFVAPMADEASRLLDGIRRDGFDPLDLLGLMLLGVPTLVTAVWVIRSALMLRAALPDLFAKGQVEGVVLRIRPHDKQPYVAVDDGTRSEIKAWLVEPAVLNGAGLSQGSPVRATVSPRLGHVFRLERTPAPSASP